MNSAAFFGAVRPMFGGKLTETQVQGLNILLKATEGLPLTHRAYLLATAHHETAKTMQPVRETLATSDDQAIRRLDAAWSKGQLKWVSKPYWRRDVDGKAWFGRGYVQITHKDNYARAGQMVGVDLVRDPSAALNPTVAARLLVDGSRKGIFTGKRLADFLDGPRPDYVGARRVINGLDRAAQIADLAEGYERALRAAETAPEPVKPVPPTKPPAPKPGLLAAILAALAAIFGAKK